MTLVFALLLGTTPVQALGQAPIVNGNRVVARDQALDAALRQAVDQALTYVLDPDSRLRVQAQLRSQLLPRARTYVSTYRVLDEHDVTTDGAGQFQVQIEAQVDTTLLRRDAVAIAGNPTKATPPPTATGKPRVLYATSGPIAAAARKAVDSRGFPEATVPQGEPPTSDADAAARARSAGAGIVIVAAVESKPEGRVRGTDQQAAYARVELRALDNEGRTLARGAAEARGFDAEGSHAAEQALEQAAAQAADPMAEELNRRFAQTATSSDGSILVRIAGLATVKDLEALEQTLAQQPGVSQVAPRRLGGGEAWLQVKCSSGSRGLVDQMRAQGLQIDASSDREIRVRVPRGTP